MHLLVLLLTLLLATPSWAGTLDIPLSAEEAEFSPTHTSLGTNIASKVDVSANNLRYKTVRCTFPGIGQNCWFTVPFTMPENCDLSAGTPLQARIGYEASTGTNVCAWRGSVNVWTGNSPSNTKDAGIDTSGVSIDVTSTASFSHTATTPYYTFTDPSVVARAADRGSEQCGAQADQCKGKDATLYLNGNHAQSSPSGFQCDFRQIILTCTTTD